MFGAYQAGVWRELAGVFRPDIVVGASVGSLNGWEIACDRDPDELIECWLGVGEPGKLRWRIPRRLADGVLDAGALEEWIRSACTGRTPVREFGAVLSRVPDLKPTLFRTPGITWMHLAASCAVPIFLRHHRIDGHYYSDGGIVDPLPIWAAVEMGAEAIVTVDVLKHRPWLIRQAVRGLQWWAAYKTPVFHGVRIVDVSPLGGLGGIRDSMEWSHQRAAAWIDRGRSDARAALPQVVECVRWAASIAAGEKTEGWPSTVSIA
jgi:NTE family protein